MHRSIRKPAAFTLIELLAVIGIIGLLVGILIPAISSARAQAKAAATRATLKVLGDGCEMFSGTQKKYPISRGENPFEGAGSGVYLSGAQWLAVQLVGPDLLGYVRPVSQNDTNGDGIIDQFDWLAWYERDADYHREGPYVPADGKLAQPPHMYYEQHPFVGEIPESLKGVQHGGGSGGSSDWNNGAIPFFVDSFGYPILYYAANPYAKQIVSLNLNANEVGVYDQTDNAHFTGSEGGYGFYTVAEPGWDLGAGAYQQNAPRYHPLGTLGYHSPTQIDPPDPRSFAYFIFDRNLYDMTDKGSGGRIEPLRKDSFLLISPGADGRYGTLDDVRNF